MKSTLKIWSLQMLSQQLKQTINHQVIQNEWCTYATTTNKHNHSY
uniref:Uncharacterized protein n=1 Tax=Rhizophora mucronata TaxID=61149 RepID=A0A2P2PEG0_RHIMU